MTYISQGYELWLCEISTEEPDQDIPMVEPVYRRVIAWEKTDEGMNPVVLSSPGPIAETYDSRFPITDTGVSAVGVGVTREEAREEAGRDFKERRMELIKEWEKILANDPSSGV